MEELNKNQIVLLTLLVSFVTSIATGIVTVTLMDQAPAGVTQTINRVVERTIEKVVPGEVTERTVIKEVPVVVTEEELIVKVINEASPAVVKVSKRSGEMVGSGFLASDDGLVLTSAGAFAGAQVGQTYRIAWRTGDTASARLIKISPADGIVALRVDSAELKSLKDRLAAVAAATSTAPKLVWHSLGLQDGEAAAGQTVISLGSPDDGPLNVSVGIISALGPASSSSPQLIVRTNAANAYNSGGPILNTKGKLVGLSREPGSAVSISTLKSFIASLAS